MKNEWLQRLLQTFLFIFILKGFSLSKKCNFPVDIVFVLDGSERISSEFNNQIGYVISIIEAAGGISKTGLHASVVIVEANPKIQIPLNAHDNTLSFENNLYKLEHTYESSRIDASLLEAENSFITGSRKGALPVLILLTDGHHHDSYTYPTTVMKRLMLKGIIPYIVVVGTDFNMNNLENLIGKDLNDLQNKEVQHIFQPHEQISFDADISQSICNSFIWKMGEKLSKFSIGFVVDRTTGLKGSEKYLENQVNFVKYIYSKFAFEKQDLFSYGFYDGNSRFNKYFSEFQKNSFLQIHHDSFKELLSSVHKSFLGQMNDDLKKILVIFWGSLDKETVKDELNAFKSAGIVVFIITALDGPSKEAMIFNGGKLFNQVNDANTRMEVVGKIYDGIIARTNLFDTNECKSVIDLMFLVDTSGSMSKHYIDLLKVLKRIVAEFQISEHGSHAAVLSFNSYGSSVINFNSYFDNGMFNQALDEIPGPKGLIDMNAALTEVLNKLIKSNESRNLVAKVLFIFTDGFQVGGSFEKIVDQISNLGVKIFVIAYDGDINYATINKLLREPNNFFQISKDTEFLTESIAEKACNQAALYSDGFSKAFDIFFIFDGSLGTVQKDLAIMFVKLFKSEVKFGAMVSQNSSYVPFTFADTFTNKEYINAINGIELRAGNSDLLLAMRESRLNFFRKGFGARADVPKVLIIFTNTIMDNDQDITSETIEFKKVDISILVLGLGQNLDYKKMRLLGADNVFILSDTDEKSKENLVENLSKKVMYAPLSTILSKTLYDTQWIDVFGEFKENYDKSFSAVIPDVLESVWHFGPARIWKRPIHRSKYVIESKIQPTGELGFGSCGHIFKYKLDSTSSIKSVSKSWGYFLWVNQFLYISSDGSETSPRLLYSYKNAEWLHLRTVVDNSKVKIYINDVFIKEIIMTGEGHDSQINNYVGLWCHRMTNTVVKDFVVSNLVDQCSVQNGGCDHICNSSPYEYLCSCKVGYRLNIDERSCVVNVNESYSSFTTVPNILQNQTDKSDSVLQTTPYSLTSESITRDSNLLSGDSDLPLINSHNSFTSVTTSSDFTLNKEVSDFNDSVSSKIFNVGFLFDDSSSEHDQIQKDLCKEIIAKLSTNFYRYGIMISSTAMSVPLNISDSQKSQTLSELIDNLNLPETESQVDQTMKLASLLFPSKGISNILIVFTDDKQQNEKERVIKESQVLNAMGIEVVIIGIGAVPDKDSLHIKISTEEVVTKLAMKVNASSQVSATSIVNPTFAIITIKPNSSLDNITIADFTIGKSTRAPINTESDSLSSSKLLSTHSTEKKTIIRSSMPAYNGESSTLNATTYIVDVTNTEPIISHSSNGNSLSGNLMHTTQGTEGKSDILSSIDLGKKDFAKTTLLPDFTGESSTLSPISNIVDITNAEPNINDSTVASFVSGSDSLSGSQLHTTQGTEIKTDIHSSIISEKENFAETTLLPDFIGEFSTLSPISNIVDITNAEPNISDSTEASVVSGSDSLSGSQFHTTQGTDGRTDILSLVISGKEDIAETTLLPEVTRDTLTLSPTTNIINVTNAEPNIGDSTEAASVPGSDSLSGSQLHTTDGTEIKTDIYSSIISGKENFAETTLLPDFIGESSTLSPISNIIDITNAEPNISDSTEASVVSGSDSLSGSQLHTTQGTDGKTDILSAVISGKGDIAETTSLPEITDNTSTLSPTTNIVDVTNTEPNIGDSTEAASVPGSDSLSGNKLHNTEGTEIKTDILSSIVTGKQDFAETTLLPEITRDTSTLSPTSNIVDVTNTEPNISDSTEASVVSGSDSLSSSQLHTTQGTDAKTDILSLVISGKGDIAETTSLPEITDDTLTLSPTTIIVDVNNTEPNISDSTEAALVTGSDILSGSQLHTTEDTEIKTDIHSSIISGKENFAETTLLPDFIGKSSTLSPISNIVDITNAEPNISDSTEASVVSGSDSLSGSQLHTTQGTDGKTDILSGVITGKGDIAETTSLPEITDDTSTLSPNTNIVDVTNTEPNIDDSTEAASVPGSDSLSGSQLHTTDGTEIKTDIHSSIISGKENFAETTLLPNFIGESSTLSPISNIIDITNAEPNISDSTEASVVSGSDSLSGSQLHTTQGTDGKTDILSAVISGKGDIAETTSLPEITDNTSTLSPTTNIVNVTNTEPNIGDSTEAASVPGSDSLSGNKLHNTEGTEIKTDILSSIVTGKEDFAETTLLPEITRDTSTLSPTSNIVDVTNTEPNISDSTEASVVSGSDSLSSSQLHTTQGTDAKTDILSLVISGKGDIAETTSLPEITDDTLTLSPTTIIVDVNNTEPNISDSTEAALVTGSDILSGSQLHTTEDTEIKTDIHSSIISGKENFAETTLLPDFIGKSSTLSPISNIVDITNAEPNISDSTEASVVSGSDSLSVSQLHTTRGTDGKTDILSGVITGKGDIAETTSLPEITDDTSTLSPNTNIVDVTNTEPNIGDSTEAASVPGSDSLSGSQLHTTDGTEIKTDIHSSIISGKENYAETTLLPDFIGESSTLSPISNIIDITNAEPNISDSTEASVVSGSDSLSGSQLRTTQGTDGKTDILSAVISGKGDIPKTTSSPEITDDTLTLSPTTIIVDVNNTEPNISDSTEAALVTGSDILSGSQLHTTEDTEIKTDIHSSIISGKENFAETTLLPDFIGKSSTLSPISNIVDITNAEPNISDSTEASVVSGSDSLSGSQLHTTRGTDGKTDILSGVITGKGDIAETTSLPEITDDTSTLSPNTNIVDVTNTEPNIGDSTEAASVPGSDSLSGSQLHTTDGTEIKTDIHSSIISGKENYAETTLLPDFIGESSTLSPISNIIDITNAEPNISDSTEASVVSGSDSLSGSQLRTTQGTDGKTDILSAVISGKGDIPKTTSSPEITDNTSTLSPTTNIVDVTNTEPNIGDSTEAASVPGSDSLTGNKLHNTEGTEIKTDILSTIVTGKEDFAETTLLPEITRDTSTLSPTSNIVDVTNTEPNISDSTEASVVSGSDSLSSSQLHTTQGTDAKTDILSLVISGKGDIAETTSLPEITDDTLTLSPTTIIVDVNNTEPNISDSTEAALVTGSDILSGSQLHTTEDTEIKTDIHSSIISGKENFAETTLLPDFIGKSSTLSPISNIVDITNAEPNISDSTEASVVSGSDSLSGSQLHTTRGTDGKTDILSGVITGKGDIAETTSLPEITDDTSTLSPNTNIVDVTNTEPNIGDSTEAASVPGSDSLSGSQLHTTDGTEIKTDIHSSIISGKENYAETTLLPDFIGESSTLSPISNIIDITNAEPNISDSTEASVVSGSDSLSGSQLRTTQGTDGKTDILSAVISGKGDIPKTTSSPEITDNTSTLSPTTNIVDVTNTEPNIGDSTEAASVPGSDSLTGNKLHNTEGTEIKTDILSRIVTGKEDFAETTLLPEITRDTSTLSPTSNIVDVTNTEPNISDSTEASVVSGSDSLSSSQLHTTQGTDAKTDILSLVISGKGDIAETTSLPEITDDTLTLSPTTIIVDVNNTEPNISDSTEAALVTGSDILSGSQLHTTEDTEIKTDIHSSIISGKENFAETTLLPDFIGKSSTLSPISNIIDITNAEPNISDSTEASVVSGSDRSSGSQLHTTQDTDGKTDILSGVITEKGDIAETTSLPEITDNTLTLSPTTNIVDVINTKPNVSDTTEASVVSGSDSLSSSQLHTTQGTDGRTDILSVVITEKGDIAETTLLPSFIGEFSTLSPISNIVDITNAKPNISDSTEASVVSGSDSLSGSQLHTTHSTDSKTDIFSLVISGKGDIAETTLLPDFTGNTLTLSPTTNIVDVTNAEPNIGDTTAAASVPGGDNLSGSQLHTTEGTEIKTNIHSSIISGKEDFAETTLLPEITRDTSTLSPTSNIVDVTNTEPNISVSTKASVFSGSDSLSGSQLHSTQGTDGKTDILSVVISRKGDIAKTTLLPDFTDDTSTLNPTTNIVDVTTTEPNIGDSTEAASVPGSDSSSGSQLHTTEGPEIQTAIYSSIISGKENFAETTLMPEFIGESSTLSPISNIIDVTNAEPIISDSTEATSVPGSNSLSGSPMHTTEGTEIKTDFLSLIVTGKVDFAETTLLPEITRDTSTLSPTTNIVDVTNTEPNISDSTEAILVPGSNSLLGSQLHTTQGTDSKTDILSLFVSGKGDIAETTLLPKVTRDSSTLSPTTNIVDVTTTEPIIGDSTEAASVPGSDSLSGSQLHTTKDPEIQTDIHSSIISGKENFAETTLLPDFIGDSSTFSPISNIVDITNAEPNISDSTEASIVSGSDSLSGSQLHTKQATDGETDILSVVISGKGDIAETTSLPEITDDTLTLNPTTNIVDVIKTEPNISDSTEATPVPGSNSLSGSPMHTTEGTEIKTDILSSIVTGKEDFAETTLFPEITRDTSILSPTTNIVDVTNTEPNISDSTEATSVPGSNSLSGSQLHTTKGPEIQTEIHSSIISGKENFTETTLLPDFIGESSTFSPISKIVDITNAEPNISDSTVASIVSGSDSLSGSQLHTTQGTDGKTDILSAVISVKRDIAKTTLLPDFSGDTLTLSPTTNIVDVTNAEPNIGDTTAAALVPGSDSLSGSELHTTQGTDGKTDIFSLVISGKGDIAETTLLPDLTDNTLTLSPTTNIVDVTNAEPNIGDSTEAASVPGSDSLSGSQLNTTEGTEIKTNIHSSIISGKEDFAETTLLPEITSDFSTLSPTTNIVDVTNTEPNINYSTEASVVSGSDSSSGSQLHTTEGPEIQTDIYSSIISGKGNFAETTLLPDFIGESLTLSPISNIIDVTNAEPIIIDSTEASVVSGSDSLSGSQLHTSQGTDSKTDILSLVISGKGDIAETTLLPEITRNTSTLSPTTNIVDVTNTKPNISDSSEAISVPGSNSVSGSQLHTTQGTDSKTDILSLFVSGKGDIAETTLLPKVTRDSSTLSPTTNIVDVTTTEPNIGDSTEAASVPGSDSLSVSQLHTTEGPEIQTDIYSSIISGKENFAETTLLPDFIGESSTLFPISNIIDVTNAEPIIIDSTEASVVSGSDSLSGSQLHTTQGTDSKTDILSLVISRKGDIAETTSLPEITDDTSTLSPTTNIVDVVNTEPNISDSTEATSVPGSISLSGSPMHTTEGTEIITDILSLIVTGKVDFAETTLLPEITRDTSTLSPTTNIFDVTNTEPIISDSTEAISVSGGNSLSGSQLHTTHGTDSKTDILSLVISGKGDIAENTLLPDFTGNTLTLSPTTNIVDVTNAEPNIGDTTAAALVPGSDSLSGSELHTTQGTDGNTDIFSLVISGKRDIAETTLLPDLTGNTLTLSPTTNIVDVTNAEPNIGDTSAASSVPGGDNLLGSQLHTTEGTDIKTNIHSSIISEKDDFAETTSLPDFTGDTLTLSPTTNIGDITNAELNISDSTEASVVSVSGSLSGSQLHTTQGTDGKTDILSLFISGKGDIAETTLLPDFTDNTLTLSPISNIVDVTNAESNIGDTTAAALVPASDSLSGSQLHTSQGTDGKTDILNLVISGKGDISETTLLPDFTGNTLTLSPTTNIGEVTNAEPNIGDSTEVASVPGSDSLSGSQLHTTEDTEIKTNIHSSIISGKEDFAETTLFPDFTGDTSTLSPTTNIGDITNAEPNISYSTEASVVSGSDSLSGSQLRTTQATYGKTDILSLVISGKGDIAETTLLPEITRDFSTLSPTTNIVDVTNAEPIISDSTESASVPGSDSLSGSHLHTTEGTEIKTDILSSIVAGKEDIAKTTLLADFTGESLTLSPTSKIFDITNAEPNISESTEASVGSGSDILSSNQLHTTHGTEGKTDILSSLITGKEDFSETTLLPDFTGDTLTLSPTFNIGEVTNAEPNNSDSTEASRFSGSDSFSSSHLHSTLGTVGKTDSLSSVFSGTEDIAETTLLPDFTGESSNLFFSGSDNLLGSQLHTTQVTDGKTDNHFPGNEVRDETTFLPNFTDESPTLIHTSSFVPFTNADIMSSASPGLSSVSGQNSQLSTQLLSSQDSLSLVDNIKSPEVSYHSCNVTIKCNSHSMHVSIRDIDLTSASHSFISLNSSDPKCYPFFNGSHYVFIVPLFECGTIRRYLNSAVVYSNVITDSIKSGSLISRSKINIPFSCVYPTESRVSPVSFQVNDIASNLIGEQLGFGKFEININIYHDSSFSHLLQTNDYPMEIDDRLYFEVKLESNDNLLILSVENCFITPTSDKNDSRKHFLLKDGCKEDETLVKHSSPPGSQRMSYESFSFIGVESSLTYLHCDVFVCDSRVSDTHCLKDKCILGRKRRHLNNIINLEAFNTFQAKSGPIFVDNRHSVYKAELNESIKESKALRSFYNMRNHSSNLIVLISLVVAVCVLTLPFVILNRRFNNKYDAGSLP
ncbi:mucin-3B isoform X8 [Hydra vulgaris]|uniref:Mucin-3B isoform X8 n=1 Tax=Hydra vulgaris TaxID=6087 RepID=A0ABM4CTJ4_HYDVU